MVVERWFSFGDTMELSHRPIQVGGAGAAADVLGTISATPYPTLVTTSAAWSRVTAHTNKAVSAETDERYTPDWVLDLVIAALGEIDLDPCADPQRRVKASRHFTKEDNGLVQAWSGRVFLNPPYSNSKEWLQHLSLYIATGAVTEAVVLLPVMALSNKSARLLLRQQAEGFVLLDRNLSFLDASYKPIGEANCFPSALVYIGSNFYGFLSAMGDVGISCTIKKQHSQTKVISCKYCGKPFTAIRSTARYCSTTCRVEAYRRRSRK